MKNLNPLEKDIEKAVCTYARELGMLCYKFTSPSRRSVPDRIFFTFSGGVFLIEFKRAGQKPTPSQQVEIEKLRNQGITVYVVDEVAFGKQIIKSHGSRKDPLDDY